MRITYPRNATLKHESNSKLVIFEKPAYRENLEYTVESIAKNSKQDSKQAKERVKTILEDFRHRLCIVFCLKPSTVDSLYKYLLKDKKLKDRITLSHGNEKTIKTDAMENEARGQMEKRRS